MPGHVFVVPGSLNHLLCDDILVPTDHAGGVDHKWFGLFGWDDSTGPAAAQRLPTVERPGRVVAVDPQVPGDDGPRKWLVAVGRESDANGVEWLIDGVRQALDAVAASPRPEGVGPRRRIALPVVGVDKGGFDGFRGAVITELLAEARSVADRHAVDVIIVARDRANYSAVQTLRARDAPALPPVLETAAVDLAGLAVMSRDVVLV